MVGVGLFAQPDGLTYYIVKKDSSKMLCKILAEKNKGYFIKQADGKELVVLKTEIDSVYLLDEQGYKWNIKEFNSRELKDLRHDAVIKNRPDVNLRYYSDSVISAYDEYKIVIDGKCKLLSQTKGAPTVQSAWETQQLQWERYSFYYKGIVIAVSSENIWDADANTGFRSTCRILFTECPVLLEKIEKRELNSKNMRQIVTEFNQCLETKK